MKILNYKFDHTFFMLLLAFVCGLAVSSSGCVESETETVSSNAPPTIGLKSDVSRFDAAENTNEYSISS
jgi:hypothetical protein